MFIEVVEVEDEDNNKIENVPKNDKKEIKESPRCEEIDGMIKSSKGSG